MRIKGMVLAAVLFLSVIMLIFAISIAGLSSTNYDITRSARDRIKALNAAEAGIARAIYYVNTEPNSTWVKFSGEGNDILNNEKTGDMPDTNTSFKIYFTNNLSESSTLNGYRGEVIPPLSAQIISIGEAGPERAKVQRTLVCLLKISQMDAYSCATTGMVSAVDGDLMVDGIDSITTWNPIDGNVHTNLQTETTSFKWNGSGVYECDISGNVSTLSDKSTIKFYQDTGIPYSKEFKTLGNVNVNLPPALDEMLAPKNMSAIPKVPNATANGDVILGNKTYKFEGDGNTVFRIKGKLQMDESTIFVKDADLIIEGGIEGDGIVSVSGYKDLGLFDYWKEEGSTFIESKDVLVKRKYFPPSSDESKSTPTDSSLKSPGSSPESSNIIEYGLNRSYVLVNNAGPAREYTSRKIPSSVIVSDSGAGIVTAASSRKNSVNPKDYPPGAIINQQRTNDVDWRVEDEPTGEKWTEREDADNGGYWISYYEKVNTYDKKYRRFVVDVQGPADATVQGTVDMDTDNINGVAIYTQGKLTINGAENDIAMGKLKNEVLKLAKDAPDSQLLIDFLEDDMVVKIKGKEYAFTGIKDWLESHPSLKYKTVKQLKENGSAVLNVIAQYVSNYQFIQGVLYAEGGVEANGKVKIIGGIIVNNDDPRAGINLNRGALITCNGEYLRIFEEYTKNPIYAPTAWHELH